MNKIINYTVIALSIFSCFYVNTTPMQSVCLDQETPLVHTFNDKKTRNCSQISCFIEQTDNWSCGYRVLFHALAIERALKSGNFEQALESNLQDQELLNHVYTIHDQAHPLSNHELEDIAQKLRIDDRFIVVSYENNEVMYLGPVCINCSDSTNQATREDLFAQERRNKLDETLTSFSHKLQKTPQAAYVVCGTEGHWILFAFVSLPGKPVQLYLLDSANVGLRPERKECLYTLKNYLDVLNGDQAYTEYPRIVRYAAQPSIFYPDGNFFNSLTGFTILLCILKIAHVILHAYRRKNNKVL